jgi:predicted nucleotidyltransferase
MTEVREIADNLGAVVEEILGRFRPAKVILFGSYASGQPSVDSDVDLLIVTPDAPGWKEAYRFRMELQSKFRLRLHLVFMREEEFEETKDVVGGLAFPASRGGKMLYEQKP